MNWDQFHQYIGVPGILALLTTVAMIAWISFGIEMPPEVYTLMGASWGYYFGAGQGTKAIRAGASKLTGS